MAKGQNQQEKPSFGQELLAVLGIFIAFFLFICLASYSLPQGQLAEAVAAAPNWGGKVGFFFAHLLAGFLGLSAFWLPILLLVFAVQLFSPQASFERLPFIAAGFSGIVIASSELIAGTGAAPLHIFGKVFPRGGYLGDLLQRFFQTMLGGPGSLLFFGAIFVVSMMAAVSFSPYLWGIKIQRLWELARAAHQRRQEEKDIKAAEVSTTTEPGEAEASPARERGLPRVHEPVRLEISEESDDEFQPLPVSSGAFCLPGLNLLDKPEEQKVAIDQDYYFDLSRQLEKTLKDFGVIGEVSGISPGPIVTTYEFSPAPGVKINKVVALTDDLALSIKAESVRIVGSIPGKAAIGIEIPNPERQIVHIRDILSSDVYQKAVSRLTIALGKDVVGNPVVANLAKMPHLLIAGATGAGKSVGINAIIASILLKATPDEVRLLMIDPKRIELSSYEDIPHLLHPVVVDPKMASRALLWAVREMERRYELMEEARVKSLAGYNEVAEIKLPLIVIIIDELADLMMVSSREVEDSVARLAQMARAAGMHLILATQRPSVDVLTGLIKANFPTRISFKVASKIDSRTILDASGAEHLLGAGDMLFLPPGVAKLQRIHGAYISEKESERIVTFLKEQGKARYEESVLTIADEPEESEPGDSEYDEKYNEAVALVSETGQASISMVQRRLRVGYNRAARMIETMEREGVVGPADGSKSREVLVKKI
ncbi:MAG: cell division protein FtsK [Deltaproteobacteria bacterium RIFOXYD12_FULL_50_9]|nr:MAG: cell division protein FtsK [Deltaproteobacteria bacterium RIFOXYD12_FULL_50_9]